MGNFALFGTLAIMIIGLLVIIQVIPLRRVGSSILGVILIVVFGPTLFVALKVEAGAFTHGQYPWWMYLFVFIAVLLVLRIVSDAIFPRRRR